MIKKNEVLVHRLYNTKYQNTDVKKIYRWTQVYCVNLNSYTHPKILLPGIVFLSWTVQAVLKKRILLRRITETLPVLRNGVM